MDEKEKGAEGGPAPEGVLRKLLAAHWRARHLFVCAQHGLRWAEVQPLLLELESGTLHTLTSKDAQLPLCTLTPAQRKNVLDKVEFTQPANKQKRKELAQQARELKEITDSLEKADVTEVEKAKLTL